MLYAAKGVRLFEDRVEHRGEIAGRRIGGLKHLCQGRLAGQPRVALGSAFGKLTLQIGYQLRGIGRIGRCCFRASPSMGVPGAFARTRTRRFLHHGSVLVITTPTPTLPLEGEGEERRSSPIKEEGIKEGEGWKRRRKILPIPRSWSPICSVSLPNAEPSATRRANTRLRPALHPLPLDGGGQGWG